MRQNRQAYLKISVLLYISLISIVIFLWYRSGIVPTMIFYSPGPMAIVFFSLIMIAFVAVVQGLAYMLYRLLRLLN
jgi:hypothetical protein